MTRTQPCTPRTRAGRLAKARQFLEAAETINEFADDETRSGYSADPTRVDDHRRAERAAARLVAAARSA
jgi:hypothetical protein